MNVAPSAPGLTGRQMPASPNDIEVSTDYPEIREMTVHDSELQRNFFNGLSHGSRFSRFMAPMTDVSQSLMRALSDVRPSRHVGFVATIHADNLAKMVGEVRYVVDEMNKATAEFAIAVADEWQGCGLAAKLLLLIEEKTAQNGVRRLVGVTLNTNTGMKKLAHHAGYCSSADPTEARATRLVKLISDSRSLH